MQTLRRQDLLDKIYMLPSENVAEIEDVVEFLRLRNEEDGLVKWAGRLSAQLFAKVWDNPENAEYDKL